MNSELKQFIKHSEKIWEELKNEVVKKVNEELVKPFDEVAHINRSMAEMCLAEVYRRKGLAQINELFNQLEKEAYE